MTQVLLVISVIFAAMGLSALAVWCVAWVLKKVFRLQ